MRGLFGAIGSLARAKGTRLDWLGDLGLALAWLFLPVEHALATIDLYISTSERIRVEKIRTNSHGRMP